jgi:hypothetical protein
VPAQQSISPGKLVVIRPSKGREGRRTSKEDLETGEILMSTTRTCVGSSTAAVHDNLRLAHSRQGGHEGIEDVLSGRDSATPKPITSLSSRSSSFQLD